MCVVTIRPGGLGRFGVSPFRGSLALLHVIYVLNGNILYYQSQEQKHV